MNTSVRPEGVTRQRVEFGDENADSLPIQISHHFFLSCADFSAPMIFLGKNEGMGALCGIGTEFCTDVSVKNPVSQCRLGDVSGLYPEPAEALRHLTVFALAHNWQCSTMDENRFSEVLCAF